MPLIPPQILAALVIAVAVAAFAAGWKTKGWQEDSQALAIAETREAAMQSAAEAISRIKVVNTTANQTAAPQGIAPTQVPKPFVSPQTVFAAGFYSFVGGIALVQRNPSPKGWDGLLWGRPFVYQKTRYVRPAGIDGFETGYPRAADKAHRARINSAALEALMRHGKLTREVGVTVITLIALGRISNITIEY